MRISAVDLRDYRKYYGINQTALARRLGVTQGYIAQLECGYCSIPDYIATKLGITAELLSNIRAVKAERLALFPQYQK